MMRELSVLIHSCFLFVYAFLVQDEDSQVNFCFHMFDSDHNRVLDHTEFSQLCRLAQPEMTDAEIAAQLDAVDAGIKIKFWIWMKSWARNIG